LGAVAGTPALTAPLSFSDPRLTRLVPRWAFLVLLLAAELVALTPPFDAGKALKDRSGIVGLVVGLEGFLRSAFITGAAAIAFLSWDAARDEFIRVFHDPDLANYDQRRHSLVREILPCQPPCARATAWWKKSCRESGRRQLTEIVFVWTVSIPPQNVAITATELRSFTRRMRIRNALHKSACGCVSPLMSFAAGKDAIRQHERGGTKIAHRRGSGATIFVATLRMSQH